MQLDYIILLGDENKLLTRLIMVIYSSSINLFFNMFNISHINFVSLKNKLLVENMETY